MKAISRRSRLLAAGVAVLALEAAMPGAALADGYVRTKRDRAECARVGGTTKWYKEAKAYGCSTPALDRECERNNPKSNAKGEDLIWTYDIHKRKCTSIACYLTTACVEEAGLADDCFELQTLRRFRDNVLAHMQGGREDIARYYRTAPAIVARIEASGQAPRELARLYVCYILPSALAARCGLNGTARRIYTAMMRDLAARYAPAPI